MSSHTVQAELVTSLITAARMYEAAGRLNAVDRAFAGRKLETAKSTLISELERLASSERRLREAMEETREKIIRFVYQRCDRERWATEMVAGIDAALTEESQGG
jgi:hypothetical protein